MKSSYLQSGQMPQNTIGQQPGNGKDRGDTVSVSAVNLQGKTAVIVGGAGDIGHATARFFVESGAGVILTSRTAARAEAKAEVLGAKARGAALDPSNHDRLREFFE